MKIFRVILLSFVLTTAALQSQNEIEMTQQQWEAVRDSFAVRAIIMLARIDTINIEIDSLKKLLDYAVNLDCEAELYKIVGATTEQVADYRNKFETTEYTIVNKTGSPDDAHAFYFDEISSSNIKCLPEFSERYISMRKKIESWEGSQQIVTIPTAEKKTYTVIAGDHLRKIALEVYGNADMWTLIWDANKDGVYNASEIYDEDKQKISNPDLIYPDQILNIPPEP